MNGNTLGMDPLVTKFLEIIRLTLEDYPDAEPGELVDYIDNSYNNAWEIVEECDFESGFDGPELTVIEGGSA